MKRRTSKVKEKLKRKRRKEKAKRRKREIIGGENDIVEKKKLKEH